MDILAIFITLSIIAVFAVGYVNLKIRGVSVKNYIHSPDGKQAIQSAAKGIVLIWLAALILFVITTVFSKAEAHDKVTFFNDVGIFLGLDYTFHSSPQCKDHSSEDRGTSNLGGWINITEYKKGSHTLRTNFRYTHHSCFIGADDQPYDGVGFHLEYKIDL